MTDAQFSGVYYPDFVCEDNKIPCGRDFTVQCNLDNAEDGVIFSIGDVINVSNREGFCTIRFGEKLGRGDIALKNSDKLTVVCEPNGLVKLYVNSDLACSVYNGDEYCTALENCEVILTEKAKDLKIISKAMAYDEV